MRVANKLSSHENPLVEQLIQQLEQQGIVTYTDETPTAARLRFLLWLREQHITHVVLNSVTMEGIPHLEEPLEELGLSTIEPSRARELPPTGVTLTEADAAIVESGTLFFDDSSQIRLMPLVWSPRLFVILPAHRIVPTWSAWGHLSTARSGLYMTGLSTTHAVGNLPLAGHGPRQVYVLVVSTEEEQLGEGRPDGR